MTYTYIIIVIFLILFFLIIFGLLQKPSFPPIKIFPGKGSFNSNCLEEKVSCNTDNDCKENCSEAQAGEEIICKALPDIPSLTKTQEKILNSHGVSAPSKYCVPKAAIMDCNVATGGIPTFTGWSGVERMEFDCMCTYPLWANSRTWDMEKGTYSGPCSLNAGICEGGVFNWDLTVSPEEPTAGMCTCAEGDVLVVDNYGLPHCVPKKIQNYYSDMDYNSQMQGGQPLISLDSVSGKGFLATTCSSSQGGSSQYTQCDKGCCPYKDGVCCGDFCCNSNYPVCDTENKRCLRSKDSCSSGETKCDGGCCPIAGGTCCADGKSCCPPAFPVCDSERYSCAPLLVPLSKNKCMSSNTTDCNGGCCPLPDAVCCGDGEFCCPSNYPVCDLEMKACRKYAL